MKIEIPVGTRGELKMNAVSKSICPYCHFESGSEDPMETLGSDGYELFIRKDNSLELAISCFDFDIDTFKFDEKIKFCPMCGRKLGSEN